MKALSSITDDLCFVGSFFVCMIYVYQIGKILVDLFGQAASLRLGLVDDQAPHLFDEQLRLVLQYHFDLFEQLLGSGLVLYLVANEIVQRRLLLTDVLDYFLVYPRPNPLLHQCGVQLIPVDLVGEQLVPVGRYRLDELLHRSLALLHLGYGRDGRAQLGLLARSPAELVVVVIVGGKHLIDGLNELLRGGLLYVNASLMMMMLIMMRGRVKVEAAKRGTI